jgi:hypothetical protein
MHIFFMFILNGKPTSQGDVGCVDGTILVAETLLFVGVHRKDGGIGEKTFVKVESTRRKS